jgi:peptidyl-prolyl cis-trans isomerase A (cyclophilin A)
LLSLFLQIGVYIHFFLFSLSYSLLAAIPSVGAIIPDDPVVGSNLRSYVSYSAAYNADRTLATNRTTELFINYADNTRLDALGFAPFGFVEASGMADTVDKFYSYGEMSNVCHPPNSTLCPGVDEFLLYTRGEAYLAKEFPLLDKIVAVERESG